MFDAYSIEVDEVAVGVLVREGRSFRFFAAQPEANGLDGRYFDTPTSAERAARRHLREKSNTNNARV